MAEKRSVLLVAATEIELCEHAGARVRGRSRRGRGGDGAPPRARSARRGAARRDRGRARHHARRARDRQRGRLLRHLGGDSGRRSGRARRAAPRRAARGRCRRRSRCRSARARPSAARPTCASRGWRGSPCSAPARSRECRRSRCARSRTRSPRATASRWRIGRALEALADALPRDARQPPLSSLSAHGAASRSGRERPLPPPLPPAQRTVGQLVAESIKLYGAHFVRALPLGVGRRGDQPADRRRDRVVVGADSARWRRPCFSAAYAYASPLEAEQPARSPFLGRSRSPWARWCSSPRRCSSRGSRSPPSSGSRSWGSRCRRRCAKARRSRRRCGEASHSARATTSMRPGRSRRSSSSSSSSRIGLALLLESQAENTVRTAIFLSDAVLAPLLFLGGAILYVDQDARFRSRGRPTRGVRCRPT